MTKQKLDLSQLYKCIKKETLKNDIAHCSDTWNLDQEHSSFTFQTSSFVFEMFYTLTGVNL